MPWLNCIICGKIFRVRPCRVKSATYCCYRCHQIGEGRKGGAVRALQLQEASRGRTYTKTKGRHTHRVIAETKIGRPLKSGEIVHHVDGDILNNSPDNLEVLPSQSVHTRLHGLGGKNQ